ncbi:MAG: hypothetical protein LBU51_02445 [Bacteroidales bacterium]|jgi:hypothetical protein|nr:hypothetical protein [Bacteroidales bacterium]
MYNRKAYSREKAISELNNILPKMTISDLSYEDVKTGFSYKNQDLEDNVHFAVCEKMKCMAILTNNIKDFVNFGQLVKLEPKLATLKTLIQ